MGEPDGAGVAGETPEERRQRLAEEFHALRPRLLRIAHAVLGSRSEAEDVVAGCWLRLEAADARDPVRDVAGWASVAVARAATDVLRSARVRRESYVGPWLPEPLLDHHDARSHPHGGADPADRVTLEESVSYALLVVLETLTPAERTAWVLHDVFAMPFDEVAVAVGRTPAAVRQAAARARSRLAGGGVPRRVDRAAHEEVLGRFVAAAAGDDLDALVQVLDPRVVLTSDGGGEVSAARRPVSGAERVARFLQGIVRGGAGALEPRLVDVHGAPALALLDGDRIDSLTILTVAPDAGVVVRVDIIRSPSKLANLWLPAG